MRPVNEVESEEYYSRLSGQRSGAILDIRMSNDYRTCFARAFVKETQRWLDSESLKKNAYTFNRELSDTSRKCW